MHEMSTPPLPPLHFGVSIPLCGHVVRGHLNVVCWLVRTAGAEPDRPNNDGCTPLLFACERGHVGVAQWLVREGGAKVTWVWWLLYYVYM